MQRKAQRGFDEEEFFRFAKSYLSEAFPNPRRIACARVGRLIRFDALLLSEQLRAKIENGKSLKPERTLMLSWYQRGYLYQTGKKLKTWYGMYREDVRKPDGHHLGI